MKSWRRSAVWLIFCLLPIPLLAATAAASDPAAEATIDRIAPPLTATIDWARARLPEHEEIEPESGAAEQMPQPFMVEPVPEPVMPAATAAPERDSGGAVPPAPQTQNSGRPAHHAFYTVQPGDNLFRIGRAYGLSVEALAVANQINNEKLIHPGQVLLIPAAGATSRPVTPATIAARPTREGAYVVQPGDTLERIARRLGVTVQALLNGNQIDNPRRLRIGQTLHLPGTAATPAAATPAPITQATEGAGNGYIVQRGDSLYGIGRRFGVSVQALAGANGISNPALIHPGLQLTIPGKAAASPAAAATPVAEVTAAPATTAAPEVPQPPATPPPGTATPAPQPTAVDPGESFFIWPLESRHITQRFRAGHRAIDIITAVGSPVVAAAGGAIEFSGWNTYGYGNLVVVAHGNGWRSLYAHNSSLLVQPGQEVTQGELIALSGNTGRSNWPHVHLEIYQNGRLVDPCAHLPGGC
jgi:murein DD-endopeptidase MepM/ murein hydrolase activator NlpD